MAYLGFFLGIVYNTTKKHLHLFTLFLILIFFQNLILNFDFNFMRVCIDTVVLEIRERLKKLEI